MTTLPQQETIRQYIADGVTAEYTYPFYITEDADIEVYVQAPNATPIPSTDIQPLNTAYTVQDAGEIDGGTITFEAAYIPANGYVVTLVRNIQASLTVDFAQVANFNGQNLDDALEKNMLIAQQNQTYALQRNLSYVVNSYLGNDDPTVQSNTQLQRLQSGYVWMGSASGGVVSVLLEQSPDVSTLRSELANEAAVTNGAAIVGYYDTVNAVPTTVSAFLNNIVSFMQTQLENQLWQPGDLKDKASANVPTGWLDCDGSAVSRTTYADLFAEIGTTWGVGDGSTTFNLPDFTRKTAVGSGGTASAAIPPGIGNAVGDTGGEELHQLIEAELASHTHIATSTYTGTSSTGSGGSNTVESSVGGSQIANVSTINASTGSNTPHNTIQPSAIVLKLIKT